MIPHTTDKTCRLACARTPKDFGDLQEFGVWLSENGLTIATVEMTPPEIHRLSMADQDGYLSGTARSDMGRAFELISFASSGLSVVGNGPIKKGRVILVAPTQ